MLVATAAWVWATLAACAGEAPLAEPLGPMTIELTSDAFADGQPVPTRHTGEGDDLSPALRWRGFPEGTRSLALIVDDPDAPGGVFAHWVLYGLSSDLGGLPEGVPRTPVTPEGARNGTNDFGRAGYAGPYPPKGSVHRYAFTLYALGQELDLAPGASRQELLTAMEGKVLAEGRLTGTYRRR